jgi:hypothetical protein
MQALLDGMQVEGPKVATRQLDQQDKKMTATRCHSKSSSLLVMTLHTPNTMIPLIFAIDNERVDLSSLIND